jgi:glycosyltransferase 2 family protein
VPDNRIARLRNSPWLRAGLLVLVVGLAVWGLASQWTNVRADLAKLAWYDVTGAALAAIAGLGGMMPAAIRVMFIGQLGKYVPGAVWAVAAQVELARDYQIPRRRSATASVVAMALTLVVGMIAAGVTLPLTSADAARHYWWVLALTPLAVACLWPPVIKYVLDRALKLARRAPLEKAVSFRGMAKALGWTVLGWLLFGVHAWLLISEFAGRDGRTFTLALGGYALAWAVGFLIIFIPGGIGAREVALIAVLAPVMSSASALVVALISRVVMTVGDLFWAGTGLAIGRFSRPAPRPDTQPSPVPDQPALSGGEAGSPPPAR